MNLKRQLLLVSLLTLVLPWAGCEFIRETESALRAGQQQMLAGTARAIAKSLQQYDTDFPAPDDEAEHIVGEQLYGHLLESGPTVDGYFDDWPLSTNSMQTMDGTDGQIRFAIGSYGSHLYLYVRVEDRNVVYSPGAGTSQGQIFADRVSLVSSNPPFREEMIDFSAEAPGIVLAYRRSTLSGNGPSRAEPTIRALWQDGPRGYQLEARIPKSILGTHLGLIVSNTVSASERPVRSRSFSSRSPGTFRTISDDLNDIAGNLVQPGMRLLLTDADGWRIANVGELVDNVRPQQDPVAAWLRFAYEALLERGTEADFAEPDASGREQLPYIRSALAGTTQAGWFRSAASGSAVVSVAEPITVGDRTIGAVILQQGTDAILSLRNDGLTRLMNVTLIATLGVAGVLLGYATWLSRRIRYLSIAAEDAVEGKAINAVLPSADASDEIGDLSRSFSDVLERVGEYNAYLRSLASKLSHELRTPLAIVTSSLENLEHEDLSEASAGYTARAKDGAERLRSILSAMSEASRVEELMESAETDQLDLRKPVEQAVNAYRDVYPQRDFALELTDRELPVLASPELLIQMLDKLVDNAVDFSSDGDTIEVRLESNDRQASLSVTNPGPSLPDTMRKQLFDSMVSVRKGGDDRHLGLGLYVARLIVEGHNGRIQADNVDLGVCFTVSLPLA